jgi:hypothetical protein
MAGKARTATFAARRKKPASFSMATKTPTPTGTNDLDIGEMYTSTELFFDKNKKALTIAAVAIVALVGLFFGYKVRDRFHRLGDQWRRW